MSSERTEKRLDTMLAALRDRPAHLDEITRARIGARLEAALADGTAPRTARGWRRGVVAVGVGLAAAAVIAVVAVARDEETEAVETAAAGAPAPTGDSAATAAGAPSAAGAATAAGIATAAKASGIAAGTARATGSVRGAGIAATTGASAADATSPIAVAAGESVQLTLGGAAVTIYGPGRLAPLRDGAVVEAAGIVVDRTHGDTPWSVRYHGIEVVATHATFAIDRGTETRVTVMRGELVLHCPSGPRTIHSGASATCEPAARSLATPAARPPAPPPPEPLQATDSRPEPVAADPYSVAESALRRGDVDAARDALTAVVEAAPDSLDAATALLDLARLAAGRGNANAALGYLDNLDRHPHRATLAAPAARLRETVARPASIPAPPAP